MIVTLPSTPLKQRSLHQRLDNVANQASPSDNLCDQLFLQTFPGNNGPPLLLPALPPYNAHWNSFPFLCFAFLTHWFSFPIAPLLIISSLSISLYTLLYIASLYLGVLLSWVPAFRYYQSDWNPVVSLLGWFYLWFLCYMFLYEYMFSGFLCIDMFVCNENMSYLFGADIFINLCCRQDYGYGCVLEYGFCETRSSCFFGVVDWVYGI